MKYISLDGLKRAFKQIVNYVKAQIKSNVTDKLGVASGIATLGTDGKLTSGQLPSIDKTYVGLGNVTNEAQIPLNQKGAASGVATLGTDGRVPSSQLPSYVKKATLKREVIINFVNYQFRDYTGLQNTDKTLEVQGTTFEQIKLIISSTAYRVTNIYSWGDYKISANGQLQLISSGSRKLALVRSGDIKYRAGDKITVTYSNLRNTHITCNAGDDYVNIVTDSDNQFIIEVKKALPEHLVLDIPRYTYISEILTKETSDGNAQYLTLTAQDNSSIGVRITDYGYIPDRSVTSSKLASSAVRNHHIQAGSVNESQIASSAVTADKIASNAISSEKIVNGAVTEGKIADGAVTESKLADDAVTEQKIADGAVTQHRIADGAVRTNKIYNNAVTRTKIADLAVDTGKIADGAVTTDKISDGAVPRVKIAPYAINESKIANGAVITQKLADGAVTEGKLADGAVTESKMGTDLLNKLNSAGMSIAGTLNLSDSRTAATMGSVYAGLSNGQMKFYLLTDSAGTFSESWITAHSLVAALFGKDKLGASVGDICVIAKLNSLPVYRILPLNDAKAANGGEFPGADGLETVWDKTQVNKIPGIETTANEAYSLAEAATMESLSESNMNNALQTGVYPWCTLGRPTGATGAFTCIVKKSYNADGGGYYTIEQTAYGRQDELGQIYKRVIFQKSDGSDTQYGEWIRIDSNKSNIEYIDIKFTSEIPGSTTTASIAIEQDLYMKIQENLNNNLVIRVSTGSTATNLIFVGSPNHIYSTFSEKYDMSWETIDKDGNRYRLLIYYNVGAGVSSPYMAKLTYAESYDYAIKAYSYDFTESNPKSIPVEDFNALTDLNKPLNALIQAVTNEKVYNFLGKPTILISNDGLISELTWSCYSATSIGVTVFYMKKNSDNTVEGGLTFKN